jgi:hypothetical protein
VCGCVRERHFYQTEWSKKERRPVIFLCAPSFKERIISSSYMFIQWEIKFIHYNRVGDAGFFDCLMTV